MGYCGADIKALCTEAALFALRRRYPQIYSSSKKLLLDVNSIEVTAKDFQKAMNTIVPASQRSVVSPARALLPHIWPLLKRTVTEAVEILKYVFPPTLVKTGMWFSKFWLLIGLFVFLVFIKLTMFKVLNLCFLVPV